MLERFVLSRPTLRIVKTLCRDGGRAQGAGAQSAKTSRLEVGQQWLLTRAVRFGDQGTLRHVMKKTNAEEYNVKTTFMKLTQLLNFSHLIS